MGVLNAQKDPGATLPGSLTSTRIADHSAQRESVPASAGPHGGGRVGVRWGPSWTGLDLALTRSWCGPGVGWAAAPTGSSRAVPGRGPASVIMGAAPAARYVYTEQWRPGIRSRSAAPGEDDEEGLPWLRPPMPVTRWTRPRE
ncbi:hypothetical protein GCM10010430_39440 [Kitasatospora cystarginea]|uniref:Uncharacterized protein n=1 Tax=Kitasatospora cystarginea TaxID=58350 RepID=A0ABN3EAS4_9ACTN